MTRAKRAEDDRRPRLPHCAGIVLGLLVSVPLWWLILILVL